MTIATIIQMNALGIGESTLASKSNTSLPSLRIRMPIQKRTSQTKRERQTMRVELVSRTWSCLTCKKAAVTRDALRWLCTCTPAAMCWEETVPEPRPPITDAEVAEELERIADEEEMRETEKER